MIRIKLTEPEFNKLADEFHFDVIEITEDADCEYSYTRYLPYEDILFETHQINDKYLSICEEEC